MDLRKVFLSIKTPEATQLKLLKALEGESVCSISNEPTEVLENFKFNSDEGFDEKS